MTSSPIKTHHLTYFRSSSRARPPSLSTPTGNVKPPEAAEFPTKPASRVQTATAEKPRRPRSAGRNVSSK
eukprot:303791-Hanusia_phi.AAC.1